jgi:glycosyltransferase involved in cell wall biosynthesis
MNRCWMALESQKRLHPQSDLHFDCPLKTMPVETPGGNTIQKTWHRFIGYPLFVKRLRSGTVHLLDHSFAELLHHVRPGIRKIVTVHDVIPLIEPNALPAAQLRRFRRRVDCLRLADEILCVSEFTRQTLLQDLNLDAERVAVLPNGVDLPQTASTRQPNPFLSLPGIKLLMVGSALRRKNLRALPALLHELQSLGHTATVVKIGQPLPEEIKRDVLQRVGAERLLELGLVSDAVLASAYQHADLLFFPSTLEGFGLPVLEAMSHRCPVVCSNAASIPEVAGDAALLFDPHDARTAASHCIRLKLDPQLSADLRQRGHARASQYTWNIHWEKLCSIYRSNS